MGHANGWSGGGGEDPGSCTLGLDNWVNGGSSAGAGAPGRCGPLKAPSGEHKQVSGYLAVAHGRKDLDRNLEVLGTQMSQKA